MFVLRNLGIFIYIIYINSIKESELVAKDLGERMNHGGERRHT